MFFRILFFSIFLSSFLFAKASNDEILINVPKEIKSGDDFIVVVFIPDNLMKGIAKLELELPNGFEAEARKTENGNFSFESQKASYNWLNYPSQHAIEVSINVSSPKNTDGYFVIKANAFYLSQNEPVKINIEPKIFTLVNASASDEDMVIINQKTTITFENFKSEGIACIRQVPYLENGEVYVNILVSKGDLNKYGKVQEKIPVGYKVTNLKSQNAIFVYNQKQRLIKYMWMNLPDKDKFIVSYKLIPEYEIDEDQPFLIFGSFFYAENNITQSVEIKERGIDLEGLK